MKLSLSDFRPSNLVRLLENGIANTGTAIGHAAVATKNRVSESNAQRRIARIEEQATIIANTQLLVASKLLDALAKIEEPQPKRRRTKK